MFNDFYGSPLLFVSVPSCLFIKGVVRRSSLASNSPCTLLVRIIILEMIWVVVLSDNQIDQHESQLMRRLAGLLFIDDVEAGLAAKRARSRLGLAD